MQAANRVAKNTAFLYIKMVITVFMSLYATRLILAALGSKDFGLFSVVGGTIAMLGFLNVSMSAATQRFMSYAQGEGDILKINKIFNMSVLLHLIIAFFILLVFEIAGYFLFNGVLNIEPGRVHTAKLIYQFMIISTLFSVISVPYDALLNAHENMLFYSILGIIESIFKLAIALIVTYIFIDKLLLYGALMALLSITLLIINRIYCHSRYPESKINLKANFDRKLLKEMSGFAGWTLLGSSSNMISNYGQGIVMNVFFGTAVNAAQGIANQVSGQLSAFASTMMKALNPVIAKSEGSGNRNLMIEAVMMGSKVSFFLLTLFFVPVLIEMPYIFKLWLKNVPEFAIIFCQLLLIRNLIEQLFITLASSIAAHGNIKNYQIFSSILCYFPLIVSYFMFRMNFPVYVIYISFIIYALIASCVILYFTWKNYQFPVYEFFLNVVLRSVGTFVIIFAISLLPHFLMAEGLQRLISVIVLSGVIFPIAIWFIGLKSFDKQRIKLLLSSLYVKYFPIK